MRPDRLLVSFAAAIVLLATVATIQAFLAASSTGTVEVVENISVTPSTFSIILYPSDQKTQDIAISNAGDTDQNVDIEVVVTPPNGLNVEAPAGGVVPAGDDLDIAITFVAPGSIAPGLYTVTVNVERAD